ncbi:hypothetical protein D9758_001483 [Tetrapyrgos nigripes]|uniref:Zn(2)-C6 fungal-type domain-containing protein n=1 Tax=Tetrapyrgos nigripes TaxID=182062 RepID=A0A8H5GY59_9AGAR|nr:hypothetical protein D9758_001483 [Tetrapyrgos nigripes]
MPIRKTAPTPLQRGLACLSCRKRKLKCDGKKPVCTSCIKMKRAEECEYEDRRQKSRTQKLKEKLSKLEERIKELEGPAEGPSSSASSSSGSATSPPLFPGSMLANLDTVDLSSLSDFPGSNAIPSWATNSGSPSSSAGSLSVSVSRSVTNSPFVQGHSTENFDMGSSSLDSLFGLPTTFPELPSTPWDPSTPLPNEQKRILLDIFLAHKHQCWFDSDVSRFDDHAASSSQHQLRSEPHPALMNAIYLLACHFARNQYYSEMEPHFLSNALHEITAALDSSDRLVDVVQASCLLAIYLYANCRTLEAYCHSFSAARLAVGLGLHQIQPKELGQKQSGPSTPIAIEKPKNSAELQDRIAAFWQVFMVDRCWSVANGLPVALPDGEHHQGRIKTPWPEACLSSPVIPALSGLTNLSGEPVHLPSLKAKAAALYERTFRLASAAQQGDAYWSEHNSTSLALQRFNASLPFFVGYEAWRTQAPFVDVELLAIHTLANVCAIHLKGNSVEMETIQAANYIMSLVRQLSQADYEFLDPLLSACWTCVAKLYIQMVSNSTFSDTIPSFPAYVVDQELDVLVNAMKTLGMFFPLASEHARRIEEERTLLGFM